MDARFVRRTANYDSVKKEAKILKTPEFKTHVERILDIPRDRVAHIFNIPYELAELIMKAVEDASLEWERNDTLDIAEKAYKERIQRVSPD